METAKKKTTILGIVILMVWLLLGVALLFWAVKASRASSPTISRFQKHGGLLVAQTDDWDSVRQMERMQEEIDRAIHDATEQFRLDPGATAFQRDASYSSLIQSARPERSLRVASLPARRQCIRRECPGR